MAAITGSGTINWSAIPFDPINFEATIVSWKNAMTAPMNEFFAHRYTADPSSTNTLALGTLGSGKLFTALGSGLLTSSPVVNDFQVNDFLNFRLLGMGGLSAVIDRSGPNDTINEFFYGTVSL